MPRTDVRPAAGLCAWIEDTLGRDTSIVEWTRLTGGLTSIVHRVTVERSGTREHYVLRWWRPDGAYDEWMKRTVAQEAAVLTKLETTGIPAPRVIASLPDAAFGGPAVLMTCLPGAIDLMPGDRERWLRQMAEMLVRIHALRVDAKPFESWLDRARLSPPPDASHPEVWREAIALLATDGPQTRRCFLHRDYQHFNLLWSREELTGVVDWAEACIGPPEIDVGHCRLNLTVLFSAEIADRFRAIYEAESGRTIDSWWDVHALLSYGSSWKQFLPIQIDGRAPLEAAGMTRRMEQVLEGALRRR